MPTNPIPAVPIPTARYYPRLSEIITVDDLPEFLSFVEDGMKAIFDKIHYKNLQYSKGYRGDSAFYSLDIVSSEKLAIPLPFNLGLVLNPDLDGDSSISSFPITLEYQWEILAFLKTFRSSSFSFSLEDFYSLGLQVFRISEEQVVAHMMNIFVEAEEGKTKYEQLLEDINTLQNTDLEFPAGVEQSISAIINLINTSTVITKSIPALLFASYIVSDDLATTKSKLQEFYNIVVPDGIEAHIKRIITPKAKATLALSAGIEFPRNILKPVQPNGSDYGNGTEKSIFKFAQAQLYADTEEGIGYQLELGGTLKPDYAMIGNTGLLLQLDTLKVDLSKKTNIPEADADGRPNDFVGVYARAVSVTLPSKWFNEIPETPGSTTPTLKLGASDLLIGSGGLSGNIYLETVPSKNGAFSYFNDKFNFNYPITMFEKDENGVANKKEIADYASLLAFLQELNSKNLPYAFDYPLSLTTLSGIVSTTVDPSTTYIFTEAKDYQAFLAELYDNTLWRTIGQKDKGFKVGFNKFDISFKQNKVIGSNIKGKLEIDKFKIKRENLPDVPFTALVEGHLQDNGDFNLTASFSKENEPQANLFDLVKFDFHSVELGKQDDDYYLGTSCKVSFDDESLIGKLFKGQNFEVEKLRVYSDGNIEIEGGSIPIPISLSINLGPVQMGVTNINFGSTQINGRKYNFWGFDGAISVNPLGVDARGEGIKFYYSTDHNEKGLEKDTFLRIQTIEVDLIIPGTATEASAMAIIHGMISLPEPGKSQEFIGEVGLKLPKAKISGSVGMRFMPKYPAFLLDASIELPVPIPLGFLAINAFRGLLGFRYVATKEAAGLKKDNSWYEFYKHPKPGINIRKFSGPPDSMKYNAPFSIGAGATFGTVADGGHVLSLRAMLLLSLPTLFYIEAGLNIIAGRLGLIEDDPSNPPFFAMVAFGDDSLELAAGADFSIPKDSGQIFKLHALLEAGFFFKNQKPWYVNLGSKKDPIEARILTLFTAKAFIMLSAQGIEAGARLDFKLQQSFGPAKVKLWAYLELGGKISFKRPQMGGYIAAGGGIQIKLWIINIEIVLDTIFSVESFKPFLIYAKLELSVRVKIGFVRVRKNFKVELQWDINRIVDRTPYSPLPKGTFGDGEDDRTLENVKGVHMLTNEAFALNYFKSEGEKDYNRNVFDSNGMPKATLITEVIPLDTYIDIKTAKGLLPDNSLSKIIGGYTGEAKNYTDMMPPVEKIAGRSLRQVKHKYGIKDIELKSWNGSEWEDYHPFEAVVKDVERTTALQNLPWAQWQKAIDQYDSIRVLATDPFSFLSKGEPGWQVPEQFGITPSKLFCKSVETKKEHTDFLNKKIGRRYYVPTQYEADKISGLFFKLIGEAPEIIENNKTEGGDFMSITGERNPHNYSKSLAFQNYNELEIIFPQAAIEPIFQLTTQAKEVKIRAYTSIIEKEGDKLPVYKAVNIRKTENGDFAEELVYTKAELLGNITLYNEETDPNLKTKIDKIVITPIAANAKKIKEVRDKIAALFDNTYTSANGDFTMSGPSDINQYDLLIAQLNALKAEAGNDNVQAETPDQLTFTHYYGYKGKELYAFDKVIKYNDTYLISFHPQAETTVLLQVDLNGTVLRERLVNGVVTSMQVVNNNLVLTQALKANQCKGIGKAIVDLDLIVGCESPIDAMAIIELDEELNLNSGTQYLNSYSLGFNKVFSLAGNELLWINTLENETQINWVDGTNRSLVKRIKVNGNAIKVLQHSTTEFSLVTKDKKVIRFNLNTNTKAISVVDTKVLSDITLSEITDAVIANGKTLITVKFSDEKFGLAQIDGNTLNIVKLDTVLDSPIYLSNSTLADNSTIAYNKDYLFVFSETLGLSRLIKRGTSIENASIIHIQNEPSQNEIAMLSSKPNEKGIYFSLFNNQFDNCSLYAAASISLISSAGTMTSETTSLTTLTPAAKVDYNRRPKNSQLITINDTICANGYSEEDPELEYTTSIQSVEWLSKESYLHNRTIPSETAVTENRKAMEDAIQNTVQPIWRPNTTYCLNFTLTDTVDDKTPNVFKYFYGFKTLGPVGHYPIPDPVTPDGQQPPTKNELTELSKSPLTSLRQYLDYNRSYPNADGSLLQSKPVFYGHDDCKISMFFTSPYVYHMFKGWPKYGDNRLEINGSLNLIIKDPLTDMLIDYPLPEETEEIKIDYPRAIEVDNDEKWKSDNDPRIPLGIQVVNNFINSHPQMECGILLGDPLKPKSYKYEVNLTDLKPSKLYTILANNYYDVNQNKKVDPGENVLVHQYGFQTSRYKNFEEQIQSYTTDQDANTKALFDVKVNATPEQIDALHDVIIGNSNILSDSMTLKYQHAFDRAIEGILKLSPLDPAQSTEVNKIIDSNTNKVIALLVRNPEPFNIPKIPLKEIQDTISVVNVTLDENQKKVYTKKEAYKVLHSKDYAQVLIMHDDKFISENSLEILFDYRMWNNDEIAVNETRPLTSSLNKQDITIQLQPELENTNL
ncbi:hypothetical protein [Flavobacterium quisquiliarum]|uniref:LysM domain-containing protein n=1 Tax=Flavobacterium quisquiliarum TaxID=1834436 RepID=A0ABV8WFQ1_9FLAO|nr:hypothetical protein [Flavobacterium quisquiliarum]MBW1656766.1 hypothetical protein [Flavobacterium quisquiliarum]NWL00392.1 hypothetical protein [Flavobacterium collinsii]